MKKPLNNYAFIDGQNLNLGIQGIGWKLDFQRFRVYLKEKYGVGIAYYFIGYVEENKDLYDALRKFGYVLVFKEVLVYGDKHVKGNIDAELVLQAMIDYKKYNKAVIVSSDGDFACLVQHLNKKNKLKRVLVPNVHQYSALLKKAAAKRLDSMNALKKKLAYKKRALKKVSAKKAVKPAPGKAERKKDASKKVVRRDPETSSGGGRKNTFKKRAHKRPFRKRVSRQKMGNKKRTP